MQLRDANTRVFQNPDGSFSKQTSSLPIHFKDGEYWISINNEIQQNLTTKYQSHPYINSQNLFTSYYPGYVDEGILTCIDNQVLKELNNARMYYLVNGEKQNFVNISHSNGTKNGNTINYSHVYGNNISIQVTQLNGRRKLDYIIADVSAINNAPVNSSHLVFEESIELPAGWKAELKDNMILLINAKDECVARYDKPLIREKKMMANENFESRKKTYNGKCAPLKEGEYEIQIIGNKLVLLTKVEIAWLSDANRQFPVIIDPDLVATSAWSGFYYSYNCYTPNYKQVTTSGAPGGSTITNVNLALNVTDIYYESGGWWGPYSDLYCNSWYSWELDGSLGTWVAWTCGGNYSNWNGQNPNQTWTLYFSSYDGYCYACYFGFTVTVSYTSPNTYKSAWVSMNTGSSNWCPGETRNVTVTVTNNGTATWTNAGPDVNIGCKWNADADYFVRVDANGLAPGATNTYTLTMTAPGAGANNLTFDVVKEGDCWFGNNGGSCGPGNAVYTSAAINIDGTAPSHDNLTVNNNCWNTNGASDYTITLVSTESGAGFGGSYGVMALINYQGSNAGQYGGYFSWHPTTYVWTLDQVAASGGGFASKNSGYGAGTITLISCATSLVGNQRTVVFTVRPNSSFPKLAANDVSMYTSDACNNQAGWTNYDLNFSSGLSDLGTVSNAGPIDFCDASGNFTTAVTVSSNVGSVVWDWGSNNGVWNNNWVSGNSSGVCCFPKQVSTSDGTADRMRYRVTNGSCATVTSSTIQIRDRWNEAPSSLTASSTNICSGTNVTLTANFPATINLRGTVDFYSGSCGGTFITSVAGTGGSSVSTSVTPPVGSTTYYARYNPGTGTGCSVSACVSVVVTATTPPTTATNTSTQSICSAVSATLSGNNPAVGTGLWSVVSGPSTSSAQFNNTSVYNTTFTPAGGAGNYVVRWTISNAPCTPSSADATITVFAALSGGTIASDQSVCYSGDPAAFTNSASPSGGTGAWTYDWEYQTNCSGGWTSLGVNALTYDVPAGITTTTCYRRKATNSCGTVYSNTLTITVNSTMAGGSIGSDQTICNGGDPAAFTNTSSPSGGSGAWTYDWEYQDNCTGAWTSLGINALTYDAPSGLTNQRCYRRKATNSCGTVYSSNTITVNVYSSMSGGTIASAQSICYSGDPSAFTNSSSPSGGTGAWTYDWEYQDNCSGGWTSLGVNALTYDPPSGLTVTRCYRRKATNSCGSIYSNTLTITVYANMSGGTITGTQNVCTGGDPAILGNSVSPSGGTGAWTYDWEFQNNCSGGWTSLGNNSLTYDPPAGFPNTRCYRRKATNSCGTVYSNTITVTEITLSTAPTSATATPASIPLGNSSTLTITGGSLGTSANWQWYSAGCGTTSAGSGSSISVSPGSTTTYYVRAEGTCNNTSCVTVTVTVTSFPQGVVNNGVRLYISSGTYVYVDEVSAGNADYINLSNGASDGRIECQSSSSTIKLEGDWVNDATTGNADATGNNVFFTNAGTVQFVGNSAQTIGGTTSTTFSNLTVNNTITGNGGVTVNTAATINGLLTLTDGHLISPVSGRLILGASATVSPSSATGSGSASSFVSGYLDRILNTSGTDYDFPLGDSPGNTWRPMRLTAKDATTRTWTAQFVKNDPIAIYGSNITSGESLKGMNNTYYYNLSRSPSTGSVDIKMWYDPADQNVLESDIIIGHWCDATCGTSTWDNWTKNNMTPGVDWNWDAANNWIQALNVGTFSPLAPGRRAFPLPVELLSFSALCENKVVEIKWSTASEINNDYFTVERSCDDKLSFETVGMVKGAGNSSVLTNYSIIDVNFPGKDCYYRLKQTDYDGASEYFKDVLIDCDKSSIDTDFNLIALMPNPSKDYVFVSFTIPIESEITIETFDVLGKTIGSQKVSGLKGYNSAMVDITTYSNGFYYIRISNGHKHFVEKIVKRY